MRASEERATCGIWVAMCTVRSWSWSGPPGVTSTALPSIGATASRWFSMRTRTTCAAPASASPSGLRSPPAMFPATSSNWRGAPGSTAASMSTTTSSGS